MDVEGVEGGESWQPAESEEVVAGPEDLCSCLTEVKGNTVVAS